MQNKSNENRVAGDHSQLKNLCDLLNDACQPERRDAFRELVKRWLEVGNLKKMLGLDSVLWLDVSEAWRPRFTFSGTGAAWSVVPIPSRTNLSAAPKDWAVRHFALLMLNPLRDNLRGPCQRRNCGKFYIKRRATKLYCKQNCGNAASAVKSNAALAKAEQDALLKSAAKFWPQWTQRKHAIRSYWIAERVNVERKWMEINGKRKPVTRRITRKWISRNEPAIKRRAHRLLLTLR
jgi:hypothetical protein